MYKITLRNGREIMVTETEMLPIINCGNPCKPKTVLEILPNYLFMSHCGNNNKEYESSRYALPLDSYVEYEKKDLPVHPYIVGILLGDGCLSTSARVVSNDQFIFDKIINIMGEDYSWGKNDVTVDTTAKRMPIVYNKIRTKNPLIDELKSIGIMGVTGKNKKIPQIYLESSYEDRMDLLQGLMDSDGYINALGKDVHFTNISIEMCEQVKLLSNEMGFDATISHKKGAKSRIKEGAFYNDFYRVRIKADKCIFSLPRKVERFTGSSYRTKKSSIIKIEKINDSKNI